MTRTAVELVGDFLGQIDTAWCANPAGVPRDEAAALDAEVAALRARLTVLEEFAAEVRKAHAEAVSYEHECAWVGDTLSTLPVTP